MKSYLKPPLYYNFLGLNKIKLEGPIYAQEINQ